MRSHAIIPPDKFNLILLNFLVACSFVIMLPRCCLPLGVASSSCLRRLLACVACDRLLRRWSQDGVATRTCWSVQPTDPHQQGCSGPFFFLLLCPQKILAVPFSLSSIEWKTRTVLISETDQRGREEETDQRGRDRPEREREREE